MASEVPSVFASSYAEGIKRVRESGGGQGYSEKHRLQVIAVRLLQSQGVPLRRIRELLLGRIQDPHTYTTAQVSHHRGILQPFNWAVAGVNEPGAGYSVTF